ncbi:hypothetical protein CPter91_2236 [Collimonas pratensis]|uniref:Uncharacterized protein n=1 Tax=Collimonas pratensis TaxID=279113 RepID=A0A127Q4N1_9BURK|nr:hypothetical protein CPter91_2236 [Collimonas pratensis]
MKKKADDHQPFCPENFIKHEKIVTWFSSRFRHAANWGQSELSARLLQKLHSDPT